MRLPKRQYTVGMLFPTPQMANMEKLKQEKCAGVHNTELVTEQSNPCGSGGPQNSHTHLDPLCKISK